MHGAIRARNPGGECWNHNIAYHRWIAKQIGDAGRVLDVGCGDGALIACLENGARELVGIDPFPACIRRAEENHASPHAQFLCERFEEYQPTRRFDAILFLASLHHMGPREAICKAKSLLSERGVLVIVGIAKPSSLRDYAVEVLRVLPCKILSARKHQRSSEDCGIPVSYSFPTMRSVRSLTKELLPGARLRYGLCFRYLLRWEKPKNE